MKRVNYVDDGRLWEGNHRRHWWSVLKCVVTSLKGFKKKVIYFVIYISVVSCSSLHYLRSVSWEVVWKSLILEAIKLSVLWKNCSVWTFVTSLYTPRALNESVCFQKAYLCTFIQLQKKKKMQKFSASENLYLYLRCGCEVQEYLALNLQFAAWK